MNRVRVRIPGSTSNLGAAFDALGLALGIYNEVDLTATGAGLEIRVEGEGRGVLEAAGEDNLVVRAASAILERLGRRPPGLRVRLVNRIPLRRGLGSSATATLGGIVAGAALVGQTLPSEEILSLALTFEGHPDNVAPCLLGGLTTAVVADGRVLSIRLPVPGALQAVAVVPTREIPTSEARAILPKVVPLQDAVFNVTRAALMVAAMVNGDLGLLREGARDRLHQPYRADLLPGLLEIIEEGYRAGALACFLSGAGSTVLALVTEGGDPIGRHLQEFWKARFEIESSYRLLGIDRTGLQIL